MWIQQLLGLRSGCASDHHHHRLPHHGHRCAHHNSCLKKLLCPKRAHSEE
uniref:Adherens junction associated protein 1 n=1 Tax=Mus musculus TaxID=10090 RepID=D6RH95_MOUSE